MAPAPVGFFAHRGSGDTTRKPAGMLRLAFVGDSMTYGQGLSYPQTLGPRVAFHLNGLRAGLPVEAITSGVPGGCLFHAMGRAVGQVRALEPDVLALVACANDALILRTEPADVGAVARSWMQFAPHLETALASCRRDLLACSPGMRLAVVYFDLSPIYGEVSPPAVLRAICDRLSMAFIDATPAYAGHPRDRLVVSSVDGHLNVFAHDAAARLVARQLVEWEWIPPAAGYDDPAWLSTMVDLSGSIAACGAPEPTASARALALLEQKWSDRRNIARTGLAPAYETARERIRAGQRAAMYPMAWAALGAYLRARADGDRRIGHVEADLYTVGALAYALEHATSHGAFGQTIDEMGVTFPATGCAPDDAARIEDIAIQARLRAAGITDLLDLAHRTTGGPLTELRAVLGRWEQANRLLARGADRVRDWLPRAGCADDAQRLASAATGMLRAADTQLQVLTGIDGPRMAAAIESFTAAAPWIDIEITIAADPGADPWSIRVGAESQYPVWDEVYLFAANLVRDGAPHVHRFAIPLTLLAALRLQFFGRRLRAPDTGPGPLRVYPLRITAPGRPTITSRSAARAVTDGENSLTLTFPSVFLFEDCV